MSFRNGCAAALFIPATLLCKGISTGPQLKQACETSPGNVVQINQPTKIEFGPASAVTTKCTIVIGPNAGFGVKQVGMTFAGALTIQSAEKTAVAFEDAPWSAASVNLNLSGESSELISKQSRLQATAGNVSISLGAIGKLELINPFPPNLNGLQASGSVILTAGAGFSGVIGDANVQAGSGITIGMGGADSVLKLDEANLVTTTGTVSISGAGAKTNVEMNQGTYSSSAGVSVNLPAAESGLKVKDAVFAGGSGSVSLVAGGAAAAFGGIEVNQSQFSADGSVSILSGQGGKSLVDNVQLNGATGVAVRSGAQGSTLVKNSRGTSSGTMAVSTGLGGVCISENNAFLAPVIQSCI